MCVLAVFFLSALALAAQTAPEAADYFAIRVVDEQTGRGVPLVELRTVHDVAYVTDSNGLVAFREPGLMGRPVFFHVRSHGYEFPEDGFGYRGVAIEVEPGGETTLRIRRTNVAERLYRITGAGIYRDTVLLGRTAPIREPVLNGLVMGQDSIFTALYRDKVYWFWGDTNRPDYPLGNFHAPGATSLLPGDGGLDPSIGVDLTYWVDDRDFARPTAELPGEGPTWLDGLVVLPDREGRRRLYGAYAKIRPGQLEAYERGLVVFDDEQARFEKVCSFPVDTLVRPQGHPFTYSDRGLEFVCFATAWPLIRVRATAEDYLDLGRYEAYTCLREGSQLDDPQLDRDAEGRLRYTWKRTTPPLDRNGQGKLVQAGTLRDSECLFQLRDVETGDPVRTHHGSVYYNAFRERWVMIVGEAGGKSSFLGEIWYAEADTPTGPWGYARRIITHDKYSFYNPKQHPLFDQAGGRILYLEGTYVTTFSNSPCPTPRYDYNQIMYRLDLADERLVLPVPVYARRDGSWATRSAIGGEADSERIAFFALDRPKAGALAVFRAPGEALAAVPLSELPADTKPYFYALPTDARDPGAVDLLETIAPGGRRSYVLDDGSHARDESPQTHTVCRVWRHPRRPFADRGPR